jgi:alginate O-acetyltransferase complex protein AlgI
MLMLFSSLSFIFLLFPLFLALDKSARIFKSIQCRNFNLLFISLLFYTWGEGYYVCLLFVLGLVNYIAGLHISVAKQPKRCLIIAISLNLLTLIGYKYSFWLISFFVPSFGEQKQVLPLGISFFTFHAISYLMDIYRRHIPAAKSSLDFLTYFCMFPHLVAGPIVRFAQISGDIVERGPDRELFSFGMYRFLVGLNKKIIISNSVAVIVETAFSMSQAGNLYIFDAWLGIVAYTIQIYFDFSGYSDMAIGLAAMAGFRFSENFRRPYSSTSIRDFWRRWHISLSSWIRDYLYIPLGGSKIGGKYIYRNLLIVFFLCGLWHGADITFIVWGLWHGIFLVFERISYVKRLIDNIPILIARLYTLFVVMTGWVFFRAENFFAAWTYIKNMFSPTFFSVTLIDHTTACVFLFIGTVICLLPDRFFPDPTSSKPEFFPPFLYCCHALLAVLSISLILTRARNPFIYYNF